MLAEFVRELDGEVTFLRDGKIITLALDKLSARDQQIVRDLAEGRPVPDDPAPKPAPAASPAEETSPFSDPPAETQPAEAGPVKPLISKPIPIENRTWTDIFGNQVTGKYVRIFGSNVVLLRGGKSVTVKFYELTSEDQLYVRELLTSRGQEGMIPPKVDPGSVNLESGSSGAEETGGDVPGSAGNPPVSGSGFPETAALPPAAGHANPPQVAPGFPGSGVGPGYSPHDPIGMPPGMSPPAGTSPSGSPYPDSSPPGYSGSPSGYAEPTDLNEAVARSHERWKADRQEHIDRMNRVLDKMNQPRRSHFNRSGSTGECLSCSRALNDSQMRLSSCPHCGVTWDYEIDEFGNKRQINNSAFPSPFAGVNTPASREPAIDPRSARMIGLAIGVFVGLLVVSGMVIGTIYIIMSIASASSSSQQRHYR